MMEIQCQIISLHHGIDNDKKSYFFWCCVLLVLTYCYQKKYEDEIKRKNIKSIGKQLVLKEQYHGRPLPNSLLIGFHYDIDETRSHTISEIAFF